MTRLHQAVRTGPYGAQEFAEFLFNHGADVNAKDDAGLTPLHWAAADGSLAVAEFLLTHGAQPGARDNTGKTPLNMAIENNRKDMADLVRKYEAK